jgi:delta 1-pyrroline-5-carboxylate dehydrogenase
MSRLDAAAQRFDAALTVLEAEVAQVPSLRAAAADARAKVAELAEERERLLARVAALEEENRTLAGITEEVGGRLDGAIAEIRGALSR